MVLRAAVGDFEDAQMYGTLQQSFDESLRDKRYFFLPDIRSFALVALEIVSKMCEMKFQNRYVSYDSEHVPLKLNLTNCISDEEDEFGAQYGYEIEDTHRMYDSIHPEDMYYHDRTDRCMSPDFGLRNRNDSLENLMDKNRPTSPLGSIPNRQSTKTPDTVYSDTESDEDNEVSKYNAPHRKQSPDIERPFSPRTTKNHAERTVSPVRVTSPIGKVSHRKSRKDMAKSTSRILSPNRVKSPSRSLSPSMFDPNRCVSPDPMMDTKLQELRKETESGKKSMKKERKSSFSRKSKHEKSEKQNGHAFEAFAADSGANQTKRKDSSWLSKPSSILKSITNNETAISVFKAKPVDEDTHLDAILEEDIESSTNTFRQPKSARSKEKVKAEVWDIIDEQYYNQCNKKASHNLKKTVSGESRSSLWSFISTPDDLGDDEELNDILDCLPGMAEPTDIRRSAITVEEIMREQEKALQKKSETKRFSYKDLNKSKFELIDYYEMLVAKQITIEQVPQEKREMLLNVVELKLEEKRRRNGKLNDGGVLKNDELYSNTMNPGGSNLDKTPGAVKVVSFRRKQGQSTSAQCSSSSQSIADSRQDRSKSAPLKRPRTPLKKPEVKKPEVNPAFTESQNIAKRNRARSALRKALHSKTNINGLPRQVRTPTVEKEDLTVKYATVRRINTESQEVSTHLSESQQNDSQILKVAVPSKEMFSITKVKPVSVKRYPSFSSNESSSSYLYSDPSRKADTSLTSGELTSVSSQSESDHFDADGHLSDNERQNKTNINSRRNFINRAPGSRVDSGFDSGSMSSEISDPLGHHSKQYYTPVQNSKPNLNSWARNYKSVEYIPNSPLEISSKFLPPTHSYNEAKVADLTSRDRPSSAHRNAFSYSLTADHKPFNDNDSGIGISNQITNKIRSSMNDMSSSSSVNSEVTPPPPRVIPVSASNNTGLFNMNLRPMSPEMPVSQKQTIPSERPMSPNVQPTQHRPILKAKARLISPDRVLSPSSSNPVNENRNTPESRSLSPSSTHMTSQRPFSPGGHVIPNIHSSDQHNLRARSLSPSSKIMVHNRVVSPAQNSIASRQNVKTPPTIEITHGKSVSRSPNRTNDIETSKATKRYRELVKQGVPLRASAIDSSPNRREHEAYVNRDNETMSRPNTAESTIEEPVDNEQLFDDLQSKGFFANRSRSPSPSKGSSPSRVKHSNNRSNKHGHNRKKKHKQLPLDQIVREAPDQTSSGAKPFRTQSNNHLTVSEDVFLNQPTSEDSETCSIKTTKSSGSTPSGSRPKVVVDAELVIDRIFSQNGVDNSDLDVEVEAALGLDKDPFKTVNELYNQNGSESISDLVNLPLQNGVNQNHIHECMELVSNLHVVTVRDLLPARDDSFEVLRKKLHQVGQMGTVGNQVWLVYLSFVFVCLI